MKSMVDVAQLVESRIVIPAVAGSNPVVHPIFRMGPLAQLVEQETLNLLVEGSTPSRPTKKRHCAPEQPERFQSAVRSVRCEQRNAYLSPGGCDSVARLGEGNRNTQANINF